MQHKFKLAALLCLGTNVYAAPVYQPPGPNLTYGSSSNNQSIMSSVTNPAAAAAVLQKEGSQYRFGIISIGGGYEVGDINDIFNKIDSTKTSLKEAQNVPPGTLTGSDQQIADYVNANIIAPVNSVTSTLQQNGKASVFVDGYVPITPFVFSSSGLGGSVVFAANVSAIANMTFVSDPFVDLTAADGADIRANGGTYTPAANDSALLVKAALVEEIGLGYSRSLFTRDAPEHIEGEPAPDKLSASELRAGELTAGVRAKYYIVKLSHEAKKLTNTAKGSEDIFNDGLTYSSSSGFGIDVGTLWTSTHYRAGAWINNINSPSFKYQALDSSAFSNQAVVAQLNADGTYKMKPQLQLEGAIYTASQNWVVNLGLDANAVPDPVGREFQWATLSAAYATSSWWIPGARVGYRSNLAGSKLSYVTYGLTIFKALSLDVAYGQDKVTDDQGNSIPRSAMINLGLQMTF